MLVIGLTGRMGAGKSTVAGFLRELGCAVADCDKISREVVEPGKTAYFETLEEFGDFILSPDKSIDRRKLGDIVFADDDKRKKLESIVHKQVIYETEKLIEAAEREGAAAFVIDAPLLIEAGMHKRCGSVWLVTADDAQSVSRISQRENMAENRILARLETQKSNAELTNYADVVIMNNGSINDLRSETAAAYTNVLRSYPQK